MQELQPSFKVEENRKSAQVNGRILSICEMCEQPVEVKKNGFFKRHKASQQAYQSINNKKLGTLPRVKRKS